MRLTPPEISETENSGVFIPSGTLSIRLVTVGLSG
jgi:hypothetical protein